MPYRLYLYSYNYFSILKKHGKLQKIIYKDGNRIRSKGVIINITKPYFKTYGNIAQR